MDVFPYEYIVRSTEASLRNLQMDTIDLQQLHVWDPDGCTATNGSAPSEDLKRDRQDPLYRSFDQRSSARFRAGSGSQRL